MDLFSGAAAKQSLKEGPLAARMRPRNLDEYIGQDHIVGKGRLLRRAIAADRLSSVIFYGPPGTGKTTLARVIANHTKSNFVSLNAVLSGVQHIREAISHADEQRSLYNRRTILFVDEVHRWNKSQQDALLPWVENGTIILVGATTENPFFEVNKALVSRSRVFQLFALTKDDLMNAARAALSDKERGYGLKNVRFEQGALEHLIDTANGDARSLLNALELAVETADGQRCDEAPDGQLKADCIYISRETAEESIQKKAVLYDRDGDYHYDIISAFIKSLRGRDPDAAMYWMARMLAAGEDPHFIFRRMLISACEDTGLADPRAVGIVESCAVAFDRIGLPEGRFMLTQAALYLATCPKSNSTLCFFDALKSVSEENAEVPDHLKDASRDAEALGHGKGYMYPHAYKDHWTAQQYLPDNLSGRVFYNPSGQGYEKIIRDEVLSRRELQIAAMLEKIEDETVPGGADDSGIFETHSCGGKTFWEKRTQSGKTELLHSLRDILIESADLNTNSRTLIVNADDALLLWEVNRKTPDGFTVALCRSEKNMQVLAQYTSTLEDLHRPALVGMPQSGSNPIDLQTALQNDVFSDVVFDRIFYRNPVGAVSDIEKLQTELSLLFPFAAKNIRVLIAQKIPCGAQRLSDLCADFCTDGQKLIAQAKEAEEAFYTDKTNPLFSWDENAIAFALEQPFLPSAGEETGEKKPELRTDTRILCEKRTLSADEIERWFNAEKSPYAAALEKHMGKDGIFEFKNLLIRNSAKRTFNWSSRVAFFTLTW